MEIYSRYQMEANCQFNTPTALSLEMESDTHWIEDCVGPRTGLGRGGEEKNPCTNRDSIPSR
jgi:hypothetical protein